MPAANGWDMNLLLIRHADPDYAADTITEVGQRQAAALAAALSRVRLEGLYTSPLGRARATAHPIAETQGLEATLLPWMRELNANWTGQRWAWNMPGAEALAAGVLPRMDDWHERVPYGALLFPQWQRLASHFDEFMAGLGYTREGLRYRVTAPNPGTYAIVAHAGANLTLLSHLLHWPLPLVYVHLACDPTSITELRWEEYGGYAVPRAIRVNDTAHLR
ncbi:MAG: histidine phosphatase family protein [Armatimonadota bacterium]|nr:histidine phosphatase family protein [Armatimonadota bacterium]